VTTLFFIVVILWVLTSFWGLHWRAAALRGDRHYWQLSEYCNKVTGELLAIKLTLDSYNACKANKKPASSSKT
jgi:hypothetical protein